MKISGRSDRFLWGALALGAILRLWQIRGDLPHVFHYDEPTLVDNAVWMLQHQTLNPHFFNYPTGLIYVLALLYGAVLAGGVLFGRFPNMPDALSWLGGGTYARPPEGGVLYFYPTIGVPALYLIGRCLSALAGTATILLIYEIARSCGGSRRVARLAALALALSPLAVEHAHLITTDTVATALATAALLAAFRAEKDGDRRWVVAGLLGGLAAGVKYNAGIVVGVLVPLAIWRHYSGGQGSLRRLALAGAAAVAAFLATTPFALLDPGRFVHDLGYEFHRVASITASFQGAEAVEASAIEKVGEILGVNLGVPGCLAVLWAVVWAFRTRRFGPIAVVLWVAAALMPQLGWRSLYARYLLPPWPAILLLMAWGIEDGALMLTARLRPAWRGTVVPFLLLSAVILAQGTVRLVVREARRAQADPRIEMTGWINANIPSGETLGMEPAGPFPDSERFGISRYDFIGLHTPDYYHANGIHYLIESGRARLVAGKAPYRDVGVNLGRIRENSDLLWSRGKFAIYRLRGSASTSWEEAVREATEAGNPARARDLLEEVVQKGDGTPHAWKTLAGIRAELGDTLAARAAWEEAGRMMPSDIEPPLALSQISIAMKDWDQALRLLSRAQAISPRDPLVFHNIAVVHLYRAQEKVRSNDRPGARQDWDVARENSESSATYAPGDPQMTGIRDTVVRMGQRWGFLPR